MRRRGYRPYGPDEVIIIHGLNVSRFSRTVHANGIGSLRCLPRGHRARHRALQEQLPGGVPDGVQSHRCGGSEAWLKGNSCEIYPNQVVAATLQRRDRCRFACDRPPLHPSLTLSLLPTDSLHPRHLSLSLSLCSTTTPSRDPCVVANEPKPMHTMGAFPSLF